MRNNESVLVTGATGFIGSNLVKRLVFLNYDVHIVIRKTSSLELLNQIHSRIRVHTHNGSTQGMKSIIKTIQPELVFHTSSLFLAKHTSKDIAPLVKSNILFGVQLLDAMAEINIKYFINTSTSWEHFQNSEYDPVCLYAATKKAFEDILIYYNNAKSIRSITLELFDTYGPNDPRHKLFWLLKKASLNNEPTQMSPGDQIIDLVYIDDVIDAFMIAKNLLLHVKTNPKYMVTSGNPIKLNDLISIYEEINNNKILIDWGGLPYREREVMIPWSSGELLPGWSPKIDLRKGISLAID